MGTYDSEEFINYDSEPGNESVSQREIYRHKFKKHLVAERAYPWVDRVLIIDESKGRQVIKDMKFSDIQMDEWQKQ